MTIKSRSALCTLTAIALAGSLVGVEVITSTAARADDSAVVWRSNEPTPAGLGFWSNACPTSSPKNVHSATALNDDNKSVAATRTLVAGPNGLPDVAWKYTPAAGSEGGISTKITTDTTAISIKAAGPAQGRLIVSYVDGDGVEYVGEQQVTLQSGWQAVSASSLKWWRKYHQLLGGTHWANPTNALNPKPWDGTLASFFDKFRNDGDAIAAYQFGCTGAFTIDDLKVTSGGSSTTYDLQNPLSSASIKASASSIDIGTNATITATATAAGKRVTTGTFSLYQSTDDFAKAVATQPVDTPFTVSPQTETQFKVKYNGSAQAAPSGLTDAVTVQVTPVVTLTSKAVKTNIKKVVTFKAKVRPERAGITVTFQQKVAKKWQLIEAVPTGPKGVATLKVARGTKGLWHVRAFTEIQPGLLRSNNSSVSVKVFRPVKVPLSAAPTPIYVGSKITLSGKITPQKKGIKVKIQQKVNGHWVLLRTVKTKAKGAYSMKIAARTSGIARFRALVAKKGYLLAGKSPVRKVRIRIKPAPKPKPASNTGGSTGGTTGGNTGGSGTGGNGIGSSGNTGGGGGNGIG